MVFAKRKPNQPAPSEGLCKFALLTDLKLSSWKHTKAQIHIKFFILVLFQIKTESYRPTEIIWDDRCTGSKTMKTL